MLASELRQSIWEKKSTKIDVQVQVILSPYQVHQLYHPIVNVFQGFCDLKETIKKEQSDIARLNYF